MATTTNGLRIPAGNGSPNGPADIGNLAADVETLLLNPVTLRTGARLSNNVLANSTQSYGTSSDGAIVIPTATRTRLVRIDADVDIYCGVAAATAGSLRLFANGTELQPSAANWGTFHNQGAGVGTYIARPVTAHIRWEGRLPAIAQNIWIQINSDTTSQPFWVTSYDLTVVYR